MEVKYCNRCHNKKRTKSIIQVEKDMNNINCKFQLVDQCLSYCGPGSTNHFCEIDDEMFVSESYDGLIKLIEEEYDN